MGEQKVISEAKLPEQRAVSRPDNTEAAAGSLLCYIVQREETH
jgi:hypothetical protein